MAKYKFTIVETYSHTVEVEADNEDEAYEMLYDNWNDGQYDEELRKHFDNMEVY